MKLYDPIIQEILELTVPFKIQQKKYEKARKKWPDVGDNNLILRSEMAYELGGKNQVAVSGLGFTTDDRMVNQDEILTIGSNLSEISEDIPYARITLIRVDDDFFEDSNKAYSTMRQIEYTRYHMNPLGYMMRISTSGNREPVRIGRTALKKGLSFEKISQNFIEEYHKNSKVKAVKMIFITDIRFPYLRLQEKMTQMEKITESLNHILKEIKMDCSVCNLKEVCDEVEGLRELHLTRT